MKKSSTRLIASLTLCWGIPIAQAATKEDSGWVSVCNGKNFDGLYVRLGSVLKDINTQTAFKIQGDSILATPGNNGLLTTKTVYSRYQSRVKYKYGTNAKDQNAGFIHHILPADYDPADKVGTSNLKVPYFFGRGYCQAIEFQTYIGNAGAFIAIGNVWSRTTEAGGKYSPNGTQTLEIPNAGGGGRYINTANPGVPEDASKWTQLMLFSYGADSVVHVVNGQVAAKAWDIRNAVVTNASGADDYLKDTDTSATTPMVSGHIALQTEGNLLYYRDWDIRLLDEHGNPIIPSTGLALSRKRVRKSIRSSPKGTSIFLTPRGTMDVNGRIRN